MELKNKLLNHWIEYEGGRQPNSNLLQFLEVDEQMIRFVLQYIFDGSEDDIVNLGIDVPQELFNKMVDDIETNGIATLDIDQKSSSLSSDWRMNDGDLEIRLSFSGTTLSGPIRYYLSEYTKVLV